MHKIKLSIGNSDFYKIITQEDYFVDKSLFIKEVIDNKAEAILIARPRRFGKTMNMSMLHHFFASEVNGKLTKNLFRNLAISQVGEEYL